MPAGFGVADGDVNEAMAELTEYRRKIRRPNEDDEKLNVVFNDYMNCLMGDPLLHINDSIPQIANYAMFLTEQQEPERGISELQKLSGIIKEYHSDHCLDYAKVQETLGTIYLMTANLPQAKTHFKRAFKIYEKIWADEPEMIEA